MRTVDELLDEATPDYDYDTISNELHEMLDNKIEEVVLQAMRHGDTSAFIVLYNNDEYIYESKSLYSDIIHKVFSCYEGKEWSNYTIINDIRNTFTDEIKYSCGYKNVQFKRSIYSGRIPNDTVLELEW